MTQATLFDHCHVAGLGAHERGARRGKGRVLSPSDALGRGHQRVGKVHGGGAGDIGGGARAWDYSQYKPWGLSGDAQNPFDPPWGEVDPAAGAWFSDQALQLAHNATPRLF